MTRPIGIDISKYQVSFDPAKATKSIDFIIQRTSWAMHEDEKYWEMLPNVKKIHRRGAYHYFSTGVPWKAQADFFLSLQDGQGFTALVVDYEGGYNNLNENSANDLERMLRYLRERRPSKNIIAYFNPSTYRDLIQPFVNIKDFPAWVARYYLIPLSQTRTDIYFKGTDRKDWGLWQYTSKGKAREYGTSLTNTVDLNVFPGTMEELDTFFRKDVTQVPDPPPPVDDCQEYKDAVEKLATHNDELIVKNAQLLKENVAYDNALDDIANIVDSV